MRKLFFLSIFVVSCFTLTVDDSDPNTTTDAGKPMPTVISPDATLSFPATLTGPADGDSLTAASVNGAFQPLLDVATIAKQGFFGRKLKPRYAVTDDGATPGPHPVITVQPLGPIILTTGGGATWGILNNSVASVVDLHTALGGVLATKTRYYLYAYVSGGALAWSLSTTTPDVTLCYMNGNTDYAYVGTVLTHGADLTFWEFEHGVHMFQDSGLTLLASGTAAAFTAIPIANNATYGQMLPSYYVQGIYDAYFGNTAAGNVVLSGTAAGAAVGVSNITLPVIQTAAVLPKTAALRAQFHSDDGLNLYYKWSANAGTGQFDLALVGWIDPR